MMRGLDYDIEQGSYCAPHPQPGIAIGDFLQQ
jgi:hypothetical protein